MLLLGIDIGTSFIKACILDAKSEQVIESIQYPETEPPIISKNLQWAEQQPGKWREHTDEVIKNIYRSNAYNPEGFVAIHIAYQKRRIRCSVKCLNIFNVMKIFFLFRKFSFSYMEN